MARRGEWFTREATRRAEVTDLVASGSRVPLDYLGLPSRGHQSHKCLLVRPLSVEYVAFPKSIPVFIWVDEGLKVKGHSC